MRVRHPASRSEFRPAPAADPPSRVSSALIAAGIRFFAAAGRMAGAAIPFAAFRFAWLLSLAVACSVLLAPTPAVAATVEDVLEPGKVIKGHEKAEEDCQNCHERFHKGAQDSRCLKCHDDVSADVRAKRMYHGRMKPQPCAVCHADHKGRDANIMPLDEHTFNHDDTDFPLKHAHAQAKVKCEDCHQSKDPLAKVKYRQTQTNCLACHKKDDKHKGQFGAKCESCHNDNLWKEITFDHDRDTKYPLKGKHATTKCEDCHTGNLYTQKTPNDCFSCHKKDDKHKGSEGEHCEKCHGERDWKDTKTEFDHDKTRFPLRGKHAKIKCDDCHKSLNFKEAPRDCLSCHKKDDKHKGQFGPKCETCHNDRVWKEITFDHDRDTKYPLRGKHNKVKCEDCHTGNLYTQKTPTDCFSCHKKDDDKAHKGTLGKKCEACHVERDWKETQSLFDHDKTRFPLHGKHVTTKCEDCHKSKVYNEAPRDCNGCHQKDDMDKGHKGRYGPKCETCHTEKEWKEIKFDHNRDTKYALRGKHIPVKCDDCHKGDLYRDHVKQDCIFCHKKDDKHEGQEGERCERCHVEEDWKKTTRFDHGLTRFPLLGKHEKVECKDCHKSLRYKDAKIDCVSCHKKDDDKTHKGRLGTKCELCHNARDWKTWTFDHDTQTRFKLDGGHKKVDCYGCHIRPVTGRALLPMECVACHDRDDVHDGRYGKQCERCHLTSAWRDLRPGTGLRTSSADGILRSGRVLIDIALIARSGEPGERSAAPGVAQDASAGPP
jgi:hypothetical protein